MIHLTSLCYNEEKILPYFLNYYSKFCDKITIYDNESTDNSVDIIKSYPNTEVIINKTLGEISDNRYLEIKNHSWKKDRHKYDWEIIVDIDEFIYSDGNILDDLNNYKSCNITMITTTGYLMLADEFPTNYDECITEQIQYGVPCHTYGKVAIFNPREIGEIYYIPGAHMCEPIGRMKLGWSIFKLLHYNCFGYEHWKEKNELYVSRIGPNADGHAYAYLERQAKIKTEEDYRNEFKYNEKIKVI